MHLSQVAAYIFLRYAAPYPQYTRRLDNSWTNYPFFPAYFCFHRKPGCIITKIILILQPFQAGYSWFDG
jgi:hypothetical protein